ncbi:MAG: hypothetical protein IGS03_03105 [Candidatus Sericytochromatia bacterium]|nr:hypothetical protein [Candidatus Sericytochromatia bacterium]
MCIPIRTSAPVPPPAVSVPQPQTPARPLPAVDVPQPELLSPAVPEGIAPCRLQQLRLMRPV